MNQQDLTGRDFFRLRIFANLFDNLNLTIEPGSPTLNQRHPGCKTHAIYMASCLEIVQRIEHDVEGPEPIHIELGIRDVCMVCFELSAGLELVRNFFRDLEATVTRSDPSLSLPQL